MRVPEAEDEAPNPSVPENDVVLEAVNRANASSEALVDKADIFSTSLSGLSGELEQMNQILMNVRSAFEMPDLAKSLEEAQDANPLAPTAQAENLLDESAIALDEQPGASSEFLGSEQNFIPETTLNGAIGLSALEAPEGATEPSSPDRTTEGIEGLNGDGDDGLKGQGAKGLRVQGADSGSVDLGLSEDVTAEQTLNPEPSHGRSPAPQPSPSGRPPEEVYTESDLKEYLEGREDLKEAMRKLGSDILTEKSSGEKTGLLNQGGTCYLNSLIQTLYMTPDFRHFVYQWRHSPERHGPEETCIPAQLQKVFARLELSSSRAVSTEDLTSSFGWTRASAFQQHDVSELMRVLFEALSLATTDFAHVELLYQGMLESYISSPERGVRRAKDEPYMDLQLDVKGIPSIEAAIKAYCEPEVLDGDNRWQLDSGEKVRAIKGISIKAVPPLLTLQLKRFQYDFQQDCRIKINDTQAIPLTLDMSAFVEHQGESADSSYSSMLWDLFSIFIHSGSAMGGHYHCYCRDVNPSIEHTQWHWYDFNDSNVTPISAEDVLALLGTNEKSGEETHLGSPQQSPEESGNPATTGPSLPSGIKKQWVSSTNAYMLIYMKRDHGGPSISQIAAPSSLRESIEKENDRLKRLRRLKSIQSQIIQVHIVSEEGIEVTFETLGSYTLSELAARSREMLLEQGRPIQSPLPGAKEPAAKLSELIDLQLDRIRLRQLGAFLVTGAAGETYGGKEDQKLRNLGFKGQCHLLLETRYAEVPFTEIRAEDIVLNIQLWNPLEANVCRKDSVVLPGREATVHMLKEAALKKFGISLSATEHILMLAVGGLGRRWGNPKCEPLKVENKPIKELGMESGEDIIFERVKEGDEPHALKHFQGLLHTANINYNLPARPNDLDQRITTDLRMTLKELKDAIATEVGFSTEEIHLKRSAKAPQWKEYASSLSSLGLIDGSSIFVGEGPPRAPGEVLLKVFLLDSGKFKPLLQVTANENMSVLEFKTVVLKRLCKSENPDVKGWEGDASMLRVREKKGKEAGKIPRDDLSLKKAIPRLADGKELGLQLLSSPETVGPDDIVLQVRFWRVVDKTIDPPAEIVINKSSRLQDLWKRLGQCFGLRVEDSIAENPQDSELTEDLYSEGQPTDPTSVLDGKGKLGMAKTSAFGPPLDVSGATKLKWNDSSLNPFASITASPLSLRDGSILVIRDEDQYQANAGDIEAAKAPVRGSKFRQKKVNDVEGMLSNDEVKGRPREQGIRIHVHDKDSWGVDPEFVQPSGNPMPSDSDSNP